MSIFGLSERYRENVALILKGSKDFHGCNIRQMKFDPDSSDKNLTKDQHVNIFIKKINIFFKGIMRFERTGDYVIPIVYNRRLLQTQRSPFSGKSIAMCFLILSLYFETQKSVPEALIKEKLMILDKSNREIDSILKNLQEKHLISTQNQQGIKSYIPTDILYAMIPKEVFEDILKDLANSEENFEKLGDFLPKRYKKIRKNIDKLHRNEELS